ncbi:hypothetical protein [Pseudooceanicola algae]|uniref:Phage holin protein n=1 Tax=Pseudooceanicola algae TaxID=1537215 RepID=A0A418SDF2_9RHOB|nr:hypothetical protein [Pseudooceanicola algae]QPM89395.1 hypothetical protein PSAL_006110 [Pseudooceanicola algae]
MSFQAFIPAALEPALTEVVSVMALAVIGWMAARFQKWTGVQIEEKHQRALHTALMTGIRAALEGGQVDKDALVAAAVAHAERSVPDALKALKPDPEALASIAAAKIAEAMAR